MPSVKEGFRAKLKQLDPRLRVRWSESSKAFVIEEKLPIAKRMSPEGAKNKDELTRRLDGYALVLVVHSLDWRVFAHLYHMDVRRFGGAQKYCDWLEEMEDQERRVRERSESSRIDDVSHEAFDKMLWQTQNPESKLSH